MTPDRPTFARLRAQFETALFEQVLPFWERHSPDATHGGTYSCLDRDGAVYDTTKYSWLVGRQAWMFSKLYRTVDARPDWLHLARLGVDFLRDHARRADGRVYFSLTEDGRPVYLQRKIFSECFFVMALAEYGRAADAPQLLQEARDGLAQLFDWAYDWTKVGRPAYEGAPDAQMLAVPMILLNLIEEVAGDDDDTYTAEIDACIRRIRLHVHASDDADRQHVYEHVTPDGALLPGSMGRLLNPGHAIEAGWFLQHWARRLGRDDLRELALTIVRDSYRTGWDPDHGGLFYFLDAGGYDPVQLEWSMKLWWPHCEALYAHLLGYAVTGDAADWDAFAQVHTYTFGHFPDVAHGEWFGYLDRTGHPTHRFKGGPYKGCFHVPRSLYLCWLLLEQLEAQN